MDFGAPIAQDVNVNPQKGLQTLSDVLGLKQQQQALQTNQIQQQTMAAQAQQEQQTARQRAATAAFMSTFNPDQHIGADGTLDLDGIFSDPKMRAAAGDQFPELMQNMLQIKQGQLTAKQQLTNLNDSTRTQFQGLLGGLRTDPDVVADNQAGRQKVQEAIGQFAATGPDAARIANIYGGVLQKTPQGHLANQLSTMQLQAMDAGSQAGRQAPSYVNTGGTLEQTNPQASGGAPTGNLPVTIPPGADVVHDSYGRSFVFNPKTNTVTPIGSGGAPPSGPSGGSGFQQPVADQPQVLSDVENARAVGDSGPNNRNINQHLLELSQQTKTGGWGTNALQTIAQTVGLPTGSRYQEIAAYLDRQAAMQARSMGVPNTNAGLAASERATGTTGYTPQALQEKIKFADALNSGSMAYRQGLDQAVGTGATPNLNNYQAFRSAWARNFDPDVYRADDALRRGDTEELDAMKQRLGADGMRRLATKSANLRQLESGQIPNG